MNKKSIYLLSALGLSAASALTMSSCRDYDVFDEGKVTVTKHFEEYQAAFIKTFGQPDPNQDWGMDENIGVIEALSDATRAGEVRTNRNQWVEFDGYTSETFPTYNDAPEGQVKVPTFKNSALGHDVQIPGFPHLNGLYYTANGTGSVSALTGDDITNGNGWVPAGDITPYEIQYVSNWFRTHQNPESNVKLHLSDFFIQNVSSDKDQVNYWKNSDSRVTEYKEGWQSTGANGKNIETIAEANEHKDKDGNSYITGTNGLHETITYDLDLLEFKDLKGDWTHVNNFNSGNSNKDPEMNASNPNRMIQYVTSSGTEDFRCHPSWNTDTETDKIYSWVLVRLTWVETVKDDNSPYPLGTAIPREGYYLAFDFHASKNNGGTIVNRDGYYSNWIIKITPGFFTPSGNSRRVFCEDLGGSLDFDFNDAVVDVAFEQKYVASKGETMFEPIITVQAAGGTMPIYVGKDPRDTDYEAHELHKLLDAPTTTPVNVDQSRTHQVAIFRGTPVTADKVGLIQTRVKSSTDYVVSFSHDTGETDADYDHSSNLNDTYYKVDKSYDVPFAFTAPTDVKWTQEWRNINTAYSQFESWVKNRDPKDWYKTIEPDAPLYTQVFVPEKDHPKADGETNYDELINFDVVLTPDPDSQTAVALSQADSYLRIEGYMGDEDAVFARLNNMEDDDRMTIVLVLSSNQPFSYEKDEKGNVTTASPKLYGIIVPADIDTNSNGTFRSLSYKGSDFSTSGMSKFKEVTYVPEVEEFKNHGDLYTYTVEFSFAKKDIVKSGTGNTAVYHDYLLFYLKFGNNSVSGGDATGEHTYDGNNGRVTVRKWYVHY